MVNLSDDQKKSHHSKLVTPPNVLKKKAGHGGFDPAVLTKAQTTLEENTVDFKPIAVEFLALLGDALAKAKEGTENRDESVDAIIYPAMQLRAQGAMFHYPLITQIADILVNFLETVTAIDKDVRDIVNAHKVSINVVLANQMKGDGGKVGKGLCDELVEACARYKMKKA